MLYIVFSALLSTAFSSPIALQSSVTLPPAIAANLDDYSRLHYRLGALMSDLDMLYYAEDGALPPEELKKIIQETYETAQRALNDRVAIDAKELQERAEEIEKKGIKVEQRDEDMEKEDLGILQERIVKGREELLDVNDDEENPEMMKRKFEIDSKIASSTKALHLKLKKMIADGEFEINPKTSMKILGPRGPFGTALV